MLDFGILASALSAQQDALHFYRIMFERGVDMAPHRTVAAIGYNQALENAVLMKLAAGVIGDGL